MAPKRKYVEGEKILCYHGPLLYEAKCLQVEVVGKQVKYLVHYNGWNKNWDEWVGENRMLKHIESNVQKQEELKKQYMKDRKPKGKVRIKKEIPSDNKESYQVVKKEVESEEKKCTIKEKLIIQKCKSSKCPLVVKNKVILTIKKEKESSQLVGETKKPLLQNKSAKHKNSIKPAIKIKKEKDDDSEPVKKLPKKLEKLKQAVLKDAIKHYNQYGEKLETLVKIKKEKDEDSEPNKKVAKKSDKVKQSADKESLKQTCTTIKPVVKIKKEKDDHPKSVKKVVTKPDKLKQTLNKEVSKQASIKVETKIKKEKDCFSSSVKEAAKKTGKLKQSLHEDTPKQSIIKKEPLVKIKKENANEESATARSAKKVDKKKLVVLKETTKPYSKKTSVLKTKKETDGQKEEKSATKEVKFTSDKGRHILKGEILKQGVVKRTANDVVKKKVSSKSEVKRKTSNIEKCVPQEKSLIKKVSESKSGLDRTRKNEKLSLEKGKLSSKEKETIIQRKSQRQSVCEKRKIREGKVSDVKSSKEKVHSKDENLRVGLVHRKDIKKLKSSNQSSKKKSEFVHISSKKGFSLKPGKRKRLLSHSSVGGARKKRKLISQKKKKKKSPLKIQEFPEDGSKIEATFHFPKSLENWIIDDWHQINELKKLLHLPARVTVDNFIEIYKRLKVNLLKLDENSDRYALVETTCHGLRHHFDTILGNRLLYRFERIQYADILEQFKNVPRCKIYGAIHLLRMLSNMDKYINENNEVLTNMYIDILKNTIQDFMVVMEKPFIHLLSANDYEVASPEYHRRALI